MSCETNPLSSAQSLSLLRLGTIMDYEEMADLLQSRLTKEEFLELERIILKDQDELLWEAIEKRCAKLEPSLYMEAY